MRTEQITVVSTLQREDLLKLLSSMEHQDLIDLIMEVDEYVADWDFTRDLAKKLALEVLSLENQERRVEENEKIL